jgi:2-iminobutanoate/2-iminopropanoate deaminase
MLRIPGQVPAISGAVGQGGIVVTSGVIDQAVLAPGPAPDIHHQLEGALGALADVLRRAGRDLARAMRVEAFLARADDFPVWNAAFEAAWPDPGQRPARTTLVTGFALRGVLVELQAIGALDAH